MTQNNKKFFAFEIIKTVHLVKRVIDEKISLTVDKTLTVPQAHVIGFISRGYENHEIFQKDIEEAFGLHRSSVSLMLNNMERNGYISRISVKSDARLKKIVLTTKAEDLQLKILNEIQEIDSKMCNQISAEDLETFYKVLQHVRKNLK